MIDSNGNHALFNFYVAKVLTVVFENFPIEAHYREPDFGLNRGELVLQSTDLDNHVKVLHGTISFLVREGYLREIGTTRETKFGDLRFQKKVCPTCELLFTIASCKQKDRLQMA